MEMEFTEEQKIRYLSRKGYKIEERTEIMVYDGEEITVVIREACRNGRKLSLDLSFINEVKNSILEL